MVSIDSRGNMRPKVLVYAANLSKGGQGTIKADLCKGQRLEDCSVKATFFCRVEWVRHYVGLIAGVDLAQCILEGKQ